MRYNVLTMVAAGVLALHGLVVFRLLPDFYPGASDECPLVGIKDMTCSEQRKVQVGKSDVDTRLPNCDDAGPRVGLGVD